VAKRVGVDVTAYDTIIENPSHVTRTEPVAASIVEERRLWRIGLRHVIAGIVEPQLEGIETSLVQRHNPFLATFTHDAQKSLGEINTVNVESTEFTHAKACSVEHLAHSAVERGPLVIAPVLVEKMVELFAHDELG
jgi:hypothetical protein